MRAYLSTPSYHWDQVKYAATMVLFVGFFTVATMFVLPFDLSHNVMDSKHLPLYDYAELVRALDHERNNDFASAYGLHTRGDDFYNIRLNHVGSI